MIAPLRNYMDCQVRTFPSTRFAFKTQPDMKHGLIFLQHIQYVLIKHLGIRVILPTLRKYSWLR